MDKSKASKVVASIDVNAPVTTAYNQWTQFEEFSYFMEGVESVVQLDDATLEWRTSIGGVKREWTARITEQTPDKRIAWANIDGAMNASDVILHRLSDDTCRVTLQLDYEPESVVENVGDLLGVVSRRVKGDLQRFKDFIEARGYETGAYRGEIRPPLGGR